MTEKSIISIKLPQCDICQKQDKYQVCANCFNEYRQNTNDFIKLIKQNSTSLGESITNLINNNSSVVNKEIEQIAKEKEKEKISKEIEILEKEKEENETLINQLTIIISKRKESINQLKKEKSNLPSLSVNIDNKKIQEIINDYKEIKKQYSKELFKTLLINTNSLIIIDEFFTSNDVKEPINIVEISATGIISIMKEDFDQISNDICPAKIKVDVIKNKIFCMKLNQFASFLFKFIILLSNKFGIHLPHKMTSVEIYSNKTSFGYKPFIEPNLKWINNGSNLNQTLIAYSLANTNYYHLIYNIFGEKPKSDKMKWFEMSYFTDIEKIISISFEPLKIECDKDIEVDGFVLMN